LSTFSVYCKQIVLVLDGNTDLIGLKDEEYLERKKRRDEAVLKAYTFGYFKFHKTGKRLMKQLMALLNDKTSPSCTNLSQQEYTPYKLLYGLQVILLSTSQDFIKLTLNGVNTICIWSNLDDVANFANFKIVEKNVGMTTGLL